MVQPLPSQTDTPRAHDRRREILRAAADVFRRKGYHGAGMRDIAKALQMAPSGLYYYFPSKESLLYACQDLSLRRLLGLIAEQQDAPGPVEARLRAVVTGHLQQTLEELGGSAAHIEFHALPPEQLRDILAKREQYEQGLRALVQAGIDDGSFRAVDAKLATLAMLGAINWSVMWWRPDGPLTPAELADGLLDPWLSGLRTPRGDDPCRP